ncbi:Transcriptional regulatory protein walR [Nitrincola nitratireducens]|uniref:Transcriptional regulatory protein walR n=1 Tax=Nitrincola nitratireducens TaxID=1229521 RepID=W9V5X1_9GAMM|nr:Transcriptional regulatory protein walR [Nitrincola nitratireducens]
MTKVLVVDDEPNILLSLEFLMEQAGFTVFTAEDGETALQKIHELDPNLVLLDISLPGISGFDVLAELRENERFQHLPVIMLTAHGREVEREKGMALGLMIT